MSGDRLAALVRELAAEIAAHITPDLRAAAVRSPAEAKVEPLLLDYAQVGERLGGLSESTVRKMWTSGDLPSVKVNGLRFTRTADLVAYVAALEPSTPSDDRSLELVRDAA